MYVKGASGPHHSLVWCALGSATGGRHVSAISHSSIYPIENHKSGNRDRSLKESAPSGLWNRIFTFSDLNQDTSKTFQSSLSLSPLWLVALKYSECILSQSSLLLRIQLPSLGLPCSTEPIRTFQFQEFVLISCIRMQTFSALLKRSFSSAPKVQQLDVNIQTITISSSRALD